jgi:hypothetical protein
VKSMPDSNPSRQPEGAMKNERTLDHSVQRHSG